MFDEKDLKQIELLGSTPEKILSQIEIFRKNVSCLELNRPCTIGDGITVLEPEDIDKLQHIYQEASLAGRTMKFVPASGAASRMFKSLHTAISRHGDIDKEFLAGKTGEQDQDSIDFFQFAKKIKQFAFYADLKTAMAIDGLDIQKHLQKGMFKDILKYILTPKGLNYGNYPKGLIKFHDYPEHSRTPLEEHLVEAVSYTRDRKGLCRIHFTIPQVHDKLIKDYTEKNRNRYETSGAKFRISFSFQKSCTDTIAVDNNNMPFRDEYGRLFFRPGGHGALLENLNAVNGDIVFLKNIDNVVPDRLKSETFCYKKALGGYLIKLQNQLFEYVKKLSTGDLGDREVQKVSEFAKNILHIVISDDINNDVLSKRKAFLLSKLNRPIRVCGMVRNRGEAGGGPFWVEAKDHSLSLQIVEKAQIDPESKTQLGILASSTHFNPVDIVCGIKDFTGKQFNLGNYVDNDAVFISNKSKNGKLLKALEVPGLWNGAMSFWNTVFVEVPAITFNPVKTVNDLLRQEHQC